MGIIAISGKKQHGKDTVAKAIQVLISSPHFTNAAVVKFLRRSYKSEWEIRRFADPLKKMVAIMLGCQVEQFEDEEFKSKVLDKQWWYYKLVRDGGYGTTLLPYDTPDEILSEYEGLILVKPSPRLLLQLMGTECGRQILHPNIWINAMFSNYHSSWKTFDMIDILYGGTQGLYEAPESKWIIPDLRFPNELKAVQLLKGVTIRVNKPVYLDKNHAGILAQIEEHESETALDKVKLDYTIINDGDLEELVQKVKEILIDLKLINELQN